jgi:hypothetical protein
VRHEAAPAAAQVLGEGRGRNAGGRAGEDRIGCRQPVELGEHLALDLDPLGRALLDVVGARQRLAERAGVAHPAAHRRGVVDQAEAREVVEPRCDVAARLLERRRLGVEQRHLVAGAAEHDRPGLADQAAAHQRDPLHVPSPSGRGPAPL